MLGPGDVLLLYTDGAEQVVDAVARRIEQELQDGAARDDVALLALRVPPGD